MTTTVETKTVTSFDRGWIERNPALWRARSFAVVESARNRGHNLRMEGDTASLYFVAWDPALTDGELEL